MRISVGDLRYYRDSMQSIGQFASKHVRESVQSLGSGAGVTAMREAAIAAITESVGIHGEMAQALAARLFDEVCATEGIDSPTFDLYDDIIDYGMLEEKVRWAAQYLADHDGGERFMDECGALAEMYAWRCNRDSTIRNCERNGLRYARVPTNSNPCEWCVMLASRGFVYSSADNAEAGSHTHCVVADTRVSAYDLLGAESRSYQGPLVHIVTASGNDLTITPNHPVLTTNGWVPAGEIEYGDNLICAGFNHGGASGAPDKYHVDPKIEDVFSALCFINPSGLSSVPTTSEDFHGDGIANGKVDVIWANPFLEGMGNVSLGEPSIHKSFVSAVFDKTLRRSSFFSNRPSDFFRNRDCSTTHRSMSGIGQSRTFATSHFGSPDSLRSTTSPTVNTSFIKPSDQSSTRNTVTPSECKHTLSSFISRNEVIGHGDTLGARPITFRDVDADSLEVLAKGIRITSESTGNRAYGFPIPIEISRVVHKSVSIRNCQVYNLTTSTSWYYANNIITHNCKCVVVPGGPSTTIEGYDPDAYYDMWDGMVNVRASERAKRNGTSVEGERAGIMRQYGEAAKRAKARRRR